jgi:hypothetical protein
VPSRDEKVRRKGLREAREHAESQARAALLPPASTANSGRLATIDLYLWVAFGDPRHPDMRRASDLAAANVHHALQADLAQLGAVEVLTETDAGDVGCAYRLAGPGDGHVDVEVSTVLPYAVVLAADGQGGAHYLTEVTDDWGGEIIGLIEAHGLLPLSAETCRAFSPVVDASGEPLTYFQVLFRDWTDTP